MGITIRMATEADVPAMGEVASMAFSPETDHIALALFPEHLQTKRTGETWSQEFLDFNLFRKTHRVKTSHIAMVVAVDDELQLQGQGQVVGYAAWMKPVTVPDTYIQAKKMDDTPGIDTEALSTLSAHMQRCDEELSKMGGNQKVWVLDSLGVRPSQRRRGIGSALLSWGLREIVDKSADCYLTATPAGLPLYEAKGFRRCFDLTVLGGSMVVMVKRGETASLEGQE